MQKNRRWGGLGVVVTCAAVAAACGDESGGGGGGSGATGGSSGSQSSGGVSGAGAGGIGGAGASGGTAASGGAGGTGNVGTFEMGPFGLETRPSQGSCVAPARPDFSGPVQWTNVANGQTGLMMMRQVPDGTWIEITRNGNVYAVAANGTRASSAMLNIPGVNHTTGELGLLGMEIHPAWPASPHLFLYYTTGGGGSNTHIHIDRYTVTGTGTSMAINPSTRVELLDFDRGAPWTNHVGGSIEFDPLSNPPMLYAAMGDGENRPAVQDTSQLYGKLLRFDIDGGSPYTPEVVGVGLRNPFRWSFDSLTGDLWIGDVGDSAVEEVTRVRAEDIPASGATPLNFGWPIMEGSQCLNGGDPGTYCGGGTPAILPLIPPTNEYGHNLGVSVIGGRVYRGSEVPGAVGHYFFHDIFPQGGQSGWRLLPNPSQDPSNPSDDYTRDVLSEGGWVAYTQDQAGELYAISFGWGGIYKLETGPGGPTPPEPLPATLSATGCFNTNAEPQGGLIPYDLNAPLWSDNATKRRWLSVPDGETVQVEADGDFTFPPGTVLAKEFSVDGVRLETRLFMRHPDGVWAGYTYAWIDAAGQTLPDAVLLPDEVVVRTPSGGGAAWTYPSRAQCTQCHTAAAGHSLGIEIGQLNRDFAYSGGTANQISTLQHVGVLPRNIDQFYGRAFPEYTSGASTADRALSYLHSNCSNCHRPGAVGNQGRSAMEDLRYDLFKDPSAPHPLASRFCGLVAGAGDLGLGAGALLVQPGNPGDWSNLSAGGSVLYLRMSARDSVPGSTGTMPLIGSVLNDDAVGLPLVHEWITNLSCP